MHRTHLLSLVSCAALALFGLACSSSSGSTGKTYKLDGNGGGSIETDNGGGLGADSDPEAGGGGGDETTGGGGDDGTSTGGDDTGTTGGNDGGSGSGGGYDAGNSGAPFPGYPSKELHIRIVGPGGHGSVAVAGGKTEVTGVLFGNADEMTWTNTTNGASGKCSSAPFWQSDPVDLIPGDNVITVTAKGTAPSTEVVSDTVTVTYNPTFTFADRLRCNPPFVFAGGNSNVQCTVGLGKATNINPATVQLVVWKPDGSVTPIGAMLDNGEISSSGDEIKGDGLYTKKGAISGGGAGDLVYVRATLKYTAGSQQFTALSNAVPIEVVAPVTQGECQDANATLSGAKNAVQSGASQQQILDAAKSDGNVAEAGLTSGGNGVWIRFKSGLLGAVNMNPAGTRGGSGTGEGAPSEGSSDTLPATLDAAQLASIEIKSKRVLLLDPAADLAGNEVSATGDLMKQNACPAYTADKPAGPKATLNWYRHMYEYGIVATAAHGDTYFGDMSESGKNTYRFQHKGSQEVIWTGHAIDCGFFAKQAGTCSEKASCSPESECQLTALGSGQCNNHLSADLRAGRVIMGSDGVYGVAPGFVVHHANDPYPRSLIYLGACRSTWNGTFAGEFFAAGASAVLGFSGYVDNDFAAKWGNTFFSNVIAQKNLTGQGYVQIEDPKHPGTFFTLWGAQNLDVANADILNASFESGDLSGWLKAGDGRVISKLGSAVPVQGKFMGIVSTGLGYTTQTGELKQTFCIPAGKNKASFWWKFYSEEFLEYCCSQYQDAFTGTMESKQGKVPMIDVKVDDLCDTGAQNCQGGGFGSGGCACGTQYKGLQPADVSFDQGGVYMTPWVKSSGQVGAFAGNGSVTVRFFTTDVGDSIFDTAVLLDSYVVE